MKRALFFSLIVLSTFAFTPVNKPFEGKIVYKMELEGDFMSMLTSYLPESYTFMFKDKDVKIEINGGLLEMMMGTILLKESGEAYILNKENKTASIIRTVGESDDIEKRDAPKITDMNEDEVILGYKCHKYKLILNEGGNEVTQFVWATTDIHLELKGLESAGIPGYFKYNGLNAFPLKIQMTVKQEGFDMKMIFIAQSIKKEKYKATEFEVPSDYTVKEFENNILNF